MSPNTDREIPLEIRVYRDTDYDSLIHVWEKAGLPYKPRGRDSQQSIRAECNRGAGIFFLAEREGKVIGAVLATMDGRKGWINRLAVVPDFRHSGIAALLVKKAEEWIERRGIEIVTCLIEADNSGSISFFQKQGYIRHDDIIYFSKRKHDDV